MLKPKIHYQFIELTIDDLKVVLLEINAAPNHPVQFKNIEYLRMGSYKKKLKEFPEKERELWRYFDKKPFEQEVAAENISVEEVLKFLDYPSYFELTQRPLPESRNKILEQLKNDSLIQARTNKKWDITNLGAILFARKLADFKHLQRKGVRVVQYKNESKMDTIRETIGTKGYACGFEGLISFIVNLLPVNETMGQALRKTVPMFPELSIRELVANTIIHQDLHATGTSPMIEIFPNRMEIINPGLPLVKIDRFLDSPPKSRNEALASLMRRIGVCEERGSGVDKVVFETEFYQLPAPLFETTDEHTRAILFAHRDLNEMDKADRVRACYFHAVLRYVQRDFMTNSTLRNRFGIEERNRSIASRIIREALEAQKIRLYDESASPKFKKYIPSWA